jgi:hypothetical protein
MKIIPLAPDTIPLKKGDDAHLSFDLLPETIFPKEG